MKVLGVTALMLMVLAAGCAANKETTNADLKNDLMILKTDVQALRLELWQLTQAQRQARPLASGNNLPAENAPTAATARPSAPRTEVPDTQVYEIAEGTSPTLGPATAPVTVVAFMDFQCPYCEREIKRIKEVMAKYPNMIKLVFKHTPLNIHPQARPAHAAADFAYKQGGKDAFWKMCDLIFENQKKLTLSDLRGHAQALKLDLDKFEKYVSDPNQMLPTLRQEAMDAQKCRARGTPTILVNSVKLTNRSAEGYQSRIEEVLKSFAKKEK